MSNRLLNDPSRFPSLGQAIGLLCAALVLVFGSTSVLIKLTGTRLSMPLGVFASVVETIAFGTVLLWGWGKARVPFQTAFPLRVMGVSLLGPLLASMIGVTILDAVVASALRPLVSGSLRQRGGTLWTISSLDGIWSLAFSLLVVAPVIEEFLFRGLILQGFLSRYSVRKSIIGSAVLFGIIHLNVLHVIGITALGALFSWVFVRTRSLVPCILGHSLHNGLKLSLVAVLMTVLGPDEVRSKIIGAGSRGMQITPGIVISGLLFAGLGVYWLHRALRKAGPGGAWVSTLPSMSRQGPILSEETATRSGSRP